LRKIDFVIVLFCLAVPGMPACSDRTAGTTGPAPDSPVISATPIGVAVSAIVEVGDMYRSPEIYDTGITVLEVARGEEAEGLIKNASESNAPAQNGFEYVLARVRFEFSARGAPGDKTWNLSGQQFHAFSVDGARYGIPSIVLPDPELAGELRAGDSREGWVAFEVSEQDKQPLMLFDQGNVWFKLY
jgi:hypothetical protein